MNDRFFPMDVDQSGDLKRKNGSVSRYIRAITNGILANKTVGHGRRAGRECGGLENRPGCSLCRHTTPQPGCSLTVRDGGVITRIAAEEGKVLQAKRLPDMGNYYASPVSAGSRVYIASRLGIVTVVADDSNGRVIDTHDFNEGIYATPLIAEGCLFIRTEKALYCFRKRN